MATIIKDLGAVSAYAYAVEQGYTGTEEEFAQLMASYATVAEEAAQSAAEAAESASDADASAHDAEVSATAAEVSKTAAAGLAQEASDSAAVAAVHATTAGASAEEARSSELSARGSAQTATQKASEASADATSASGSASSASASETAAAASATAAAQSAAEAAESARTLVIDPTLTQNGQAAEARATGYGIEGLKAVVGSCMMTVENGLSWTKGTISSMTGDNSSSTTRIRSSYFTAETLPAVKAVEGYSFLVYAYDNETGDFVGNMREGHNFSDATPTDDPLLFVTEYSLLPQYKYRLVVKNAEGSSGIATSDNVNVLGIVGKVDRTLTVSGEPADAKVTGDAICADYSNTTAYNYGDYALYNGVLYSCAVNMTAAEEWTPEHWVNVDGGMRDVEFAIRGLADCSKPTTGNQWLEWKSGHWASPSTSFTGETLKRVSSSTQICAIAPCEKGDVFTVCLEGGTGVTRGWFFADADMAIISNAGTNVSLNGTQLTAPTRAAFFVCNNLLSRRRSGFYAYKGKSARKMVADVNDNDTATKTYAEGDCMVRDSRLFRVTAPIASGEEITASNTTETTIAEQIATSKDEAISTLQPSIDFLNAQVDPETLATAKTYIQNGTSNFSGKLITIRNGLISISCETGVSYRSTFITGEFASASGTASATVPPVNTLLPVAKLANLNHLCVYSETDADTGLYMELYFCTVSDGEVTVLERYGMNLYRVDGECIYRATQFTIPDGTTHYALSIYHSTASSVTGTNTTVRAKFRYLPVAE